MIDLALVAESLPRFARALGITLALLAGALAAGWSLAVLIAVARASPRRWLAWPAFAYTYVLRGTPLLVQLFMLYFGLAQFEAVRESYAWPLLRSAAFCALAALALNTAAYAGEALAGALRATPPGEVEAARAYGLTGGQALRRVLLPGALRRALPQLSNEAVGMLHATSLASTVSIVELTRVARDVYEEHFTPTDAFGTVAVFYFAATFALVGGFKLLERRYLRHLAPASPR